jgi:hypothetical protein
MAQHDYNIANQTASDARTDINNVLEAIATNNSGTGVPTATFPNQWFYDTDDQLLKIRSNTTTTYLNVGYIHQTNGFEVLDDTQVVSTSGTPTGVIGDQATSTWQTGTGTTESLVSPAKVAASATEVVGDLAVGIGQTWTDFPTGRSALVHYRNTTGRPITVNVGEVTSGTGQVFVWNSQESTPSGTTGSIQVGGTGTQGAFNCYCSFIVPEGGWYYVTGGTPNQWAELR